MKILLIEEDEKMARNIESWLPKKKYNIDVVHDRKTGQEYMELGFYDLIILNTAKHMEKEEFLSGIRSLLQKHPGQQYILSYGNTTLDLTSGTLVCSRQKVRLTSREQDIMRLLLTFPERNLSKEKILSQIWGYDSDAVDNHVEVYISYLRRKLRKISSDVQIVTIRKMGYHLEIRR